MAIYEKAFLNEKEKSVGLLCPVDSEHDHQKESYKNN